MSGGYQVQKGGMAGEAGKLDGAAEDVKKIRKAVEDQMCYTPDALGGSDSGPAYDRFAAAWQAEAKTLEAALHELAGKVRVSQQNYQGADDDAVTSLDAAAGGGLTTMPAPAGGGLTTMPAPAGPEGQRVRGLDDFTTQPAPAGPEAGRIMGGDGVTTQPAPAGPEAERITGREEVTTQPAPGTGPIPGVTTGLVPGERPTLADFD